MNFINNEYEEAFYETLKEKKHSAYMDKTEILISPCQIRKLANKILILSDPCTSIFFLYYVYGHEYREIENLLNVKNAEGHMIYYSEIFDSGFGLSCDERISSQLMKESCEIALIRYCDEVLENIPDIEPIFSEEFKRKMETIINSFQLY